MAGLDIQRRVKYQEELDADFPHQVAAMPGAADLNRGLDARRRASRINQGVSPRLAL